MYDAVIVGAGPAGLNAALVLGRARRRILLCSDGKSRNAAATEMHGFLSRESMPPSALLEAGRSQLAPYASVECRNVTVTDIRRTDDAFAVTLAGGDRAGARRVILATGMIEHLPPIDGLRELWGRAVFSCPYCDGWEFRDRRLAVAALDDTLIDYAQELYQWSRQLTLCGFDPAAANERQRRWIAAAGVDTRSGKMAALERSEERLTAILLSDGARVACEALFLCAPLVQRSSLPASLGCELTPSGRIHIDKFQQTSVRGVYAAGDAGTVVHQVVTAAGSGALAAIAVNDDLTTDDVARLGA